MATTYEAIATVTVGSGGAANITFSSIPATYTDLVILASLRTNSNDLPGYISTRINNNSSSIYSRLQLQGDSATTYSFSGSGESYWNYTYVNGGTSTANTFGNTFFYFPNYTSSNNKSVSVDTVQESNASSNVWQEFQALLASTSSAITSIQLTPQTVASQTIFVQYSTATLYGIKNS